MSDTKKAQDQEDKRNSVIDSRHVMNHDSMMIESNSRYIQHSNESNSRYSSIQHSHSAENLLDNCSAVPRSLSPILDHEETLHRTQSYPSIQLSSPLQMIPIKKASNEQFLLNNTGSAMLIGAEELKACLPHRNITIFIVTWNMNGKPPPKSLDDLVLPASINYVPDLVVVGTQESHPDYRDIQVALQATIGPSHVLFHSCSLGTLHLCVFIRRDLIWHCSIPEEAVYSIRQPSNIRTKGCAAVGFQVFGTSLLFVTCHLTAHLEKQNQRIDDVQRICRALDLPRTIPVRTRHVDVTARYDDVFWFGDLNFRLTEPRENVVTMVSAHFLQRPLSKNSTNLIQKLLQSDQLNQARTKGRAFEAFDEGSINFLPTYKYDPGTSDFDTSSKQRKPAYTDRILFKSKKKNVKCLNYDSVQNFTTSDHKPVWGLYQCHVRPGLDNIPLAAGQFNYTVFLDGLKRRSQLHNVRRNSEKNCSVQ